MNKVPYSLCHCGTVLETGSTPRYFDGKPMEQYVFLSFGIFRCHFYGNAVWFLVGYRTPQYMESVKWKCQRSREFHNLQQIVLCENQKVSIEKTCKYDTTGSDDMCNCCICMVHFLVWLNDFGVLNIKGLYVKWLAKIVVMKTSWVFDIANGVVNTLSLNEHWHKK